MTQSEIDMRRSLLLAELWKLLHETQVNIETQILPQLADPELCPDPTGELSQTLSLSVDCIKQYFKTHRLVAKKRTSSSWRGHKSETNCPTRSGAGYTDSKEENIQSDSPPIVTDEELDQELAKEGWGAMYLPRGNAEPTVDANSQEIESPLAKIQHLT